MTFSSFISNTCCTFYDCFSTIRNFEFLSYICHVSISLVLSLYLSTVTYVYLCHSVFSAKSIFDIWVFLLLLLKRTNMRKNDSNNKGEICLQTIFGLRNVEGFASCRKEWKQNKTNCWWIAILLIGSLNPKT